MIPLLVPIGLGLIGGYLTKDSTQTFAGGGGLDDDLYEFIIPNWAMSALINGDYSGLTDEDEEKLNKFIQNTVQVYGNADFMLPSDDEIDLGFKWRNDIDNLGSDCSLLYLRPSKTFAVGGGVKSKTKGDIGKSGTQYGYTLKEWEAGAKKSGLLVSPTQWWKSQEGKSYTDNFGRKKKIGQHSSDKEHEMNRYGYLIAIGLDLGSKIIPASAKKYVEEKNFIK